MRHPTRLVKFKGSWVDLEEVVRMSEDREKQSSDGHPSHDEGLADLPPDPDVHLSDAEKAEVVCLAAF